VTVAPRLNRHQRHRCCLSCQTAPIKRVQQFLKFFIIFFITATSVYEAYSSLKVELTRVELLMKLHITATGCHLPYGITQCYLSHDTSEHSTHPALTPVRQAGRLLDLATPEGWKAELTWVIGYIPRWFTRTQKVTGQCAAGSQTRDLLITRPTP